MKVAIVHYWLVSMRGGEKVLEEICKLYPDAVLYTLVADVEKLSPTILKHKIKTSFLQKIGGKKYYQWMLPLMPIALESMDLTAYDLVISSEAGPAKGIVVRPDSLHICYCHSPMRYIWDLEPQYRAFAGRLQRLAMAVMGPSLRQWDVTTSARVDYFIANSHFVAKRIEKFYRRSSVIINPPVSLERFSFSDNLSDAYLCAGQITPYKKIEIAIEAFNRTGRKLDIIGSGVSDKLKAMAGPSIRFLGTVSDTDMAAAFSTCKALIFPGVEDFGIVPLEVMASGRPVIAFARGGATETVIDGQTGVLFKEQTADSLIEAIERFEADGVSGTRDELRAHAERYESSEFSRKLKIFISDALNKQNSSL